MVIVSCLTDDSQKPQTEMFQTKIILFISFSETFQYFEPKQ